MEITISILNLFKEIGAEIWEDVAARPVKDKDILYQALFLCVFLCKGYVSMYTH